MNAILTTASRLFGLSLLALSLFVTAETLSRKLFNFSFEGADELGGYVLAIGSGLSFIVALADRAHIRIDFLHQRFPLWARALLDWLAIVSLALFGGLMIYIGYDVVRDSISYGSTAPTPWATPLIYPQGLWYAALCLFFLAALLMALQATRLLVTGRTDTLAREFHPKSASEELEEELHDLQRR